MADNINETLEDLIAGLQEMIDQSAACCQEKGGVIETGPEDTPPQYGGPDDEYPDQESFFDAKCNAANAIFDTVRDMFQWLQDNGTTLLAGLWGGVIGGITQGLDQSGPIGWAISKVETALVTIAGYVVNVNLGFQDVVDAMDDTHSDCVRVLYNAADSATARANFIDTIEAGTPTITAADSQLIDMFLTNDIFNQLFDPRADIAQYQSPSPIDCSTFTTQVWDFDSDAESWTFVDTSGGSASSSVVYDGTGEALKQTTIIPGGSPDFGEGKHLSPIVAIPVTPGSSIQVDFSAASDGVRQGIQIDAIYTDATEESFGSVRSGSGTQILTVSVTKTLEQVVVYVNRGPDTKAGADNFDTSIFEVRVQ